MRLLNVIIAEAENAPCPADPVEAIAEAALLLADTALGPNPSFVPSTFLMQLPAVRGRLEAMWQDPESRRKVSVGAYQIVAAAYQLRTLHRLPPGQAALMDALRASAEAQNAPE